MVESASRQEAVHRRALELYQEGAWNQVIALLIDVDEKSDDVRSLLAAARWQVALARAQQRSREQPQEAPGARIKSRRRLSSWATRALVAANLLTYGVLIFIVLVVWQGESLPVLSIPATPPREQSLLNQAETAIAAQDWDSAARDLKTLLASQPDNVEAQDRLSFVQEQRRLESLFTQAEGYYNRGLWDQALTSLQNLRASDPNFRANQVTDYICRTHIEAIRAQITEAQADVEKLLPLQVRLKDHAAECGANGEFAAEQQLLDLYIAGIEAAQLGRWTEAVDFFTQLRESRPDYAGGQATRQLYSAHVNKGEYFASQGEWSQALDEYNAALALGIPDVMGAIGLRMAVVATLAAPTPTPTPTTTATAVTVTPTPTATPVTPTPTITPSLTPTMPVRSVPVFRPRPSATPSPVPAPTEPPAPPRPAPPRPAPTATPIPPTNTPPPTSTPLPTSTPTPREEERPSTPTPAPTEEERPPTPTLEQGSRGAGVQG